MKDLNTIAKNAGIFFIGMLTIKIFNYAFRVVSSRGLGTGGYGEYVLSLAIFNIFATIALFGIPLGITRYVSYYISKNKNADAASIIKSGTFITLCLSILLSSVIVLSSNWVAGLVHHPEIANLIRLFAFGLPFFAVLTCFEKALEGFKKMKYSVTAMNVLHVTKLIAMITFLVFGFKEEGAVASYVIGIIASSVLMIYFLEKKVFPVIKTGITTLKASRTLFIYSWPLIAAEVATPIISWTDSIILGYFFSTADVGIYEISIKTAALILIFFASFSAIVFPMMSQHFAKKRFNEMKKEYQVVTNWCLTLTLPIIVIFFFFPTQILTLFYGFEFGKGSLIFTLLTVAYLITVINGPMGAIILATGRTRMSMANVITTAALNLVLNILLIPKYGMLGAGIASMISLIFISILRTVEIYYLTGIHAFTKRFIKPIASSIIAIIIFLMPLTMFTTNIRSSHIIPISIIYAAIYASLMIKVFKLNKEETSIMSNLLKQIGLTKLSLRLKKANN